LTGDERESGYRKGIEEELAKSEWGKSLTTKGAEAQRTSRIFLQRGNEANEGICGEW
jgi:hypothetical protein